MTMNEIRISLARGVYSELSQDALAAKIEELNSTCGDEYPDLDVERRTLGIMYNEFITK